MELFIHEGQQSKLNTLFKAHALKTAFNIKAQFDKYQVWLI